MVGHSGFRVTFSLRARILTLVLLGVALPLALVGAWLVRAANRAGHQLVEAQLDSLLSRSEQTVLRRWAERQSDVRLLAENDPLARAMAKPARQSDSLPRYVREAFVSMREFRQVVFRSRDRSVRWTLGRGPTFVSPESPLAGATREASSLVLRSPIYGAFDHDTIGEVEARVATATLVDAPENSADVIATAVSVHDRTSGRWVMSRTAPPNALDSGSFTWASATWLVRRRSVRDPAIDLIASAPLDPVSRPLERIARIGALGLAVVVGGVVVLAVVGSRRLTASLSQLALVADTVARGDLSGGPTTESTDEVGRVAHAFNGMIDSVRRMLHERSQREALVAVGELAATIAHQVRTPLTAMKLDLQLANEALPDAPHVAQPRVHNALLGITRLESAVDASLRIARTGSGQFAALDVHEASRMAVATLLPRARERGIHVCLGEGTEPRRSMMGDGAAIEQMLVNVIANAIDASRATVHIASAVEDSGHILITVTDDGAGISPEHLARVGEPFFSTKSGGAGLGIVIARRVATAHGGRIDFENPPGGGTTVSIRLTG